MVIFTEPQRKHILLKWYCFCVDRQAPKAFSHLILQSTYLQARKLKHTKKDTVPWCEVCESVSVWLGCSNSIQRIREVWKGTLKILLTERFLSQRVEWKPIFTSTNITKHQDHIDYWQRLPDWPFTIDESETLFSQVYSGSLLGHLSFPPLWNLSLTPLNS